jgi:hypothetical protein
MTRSIRRGRLAVPVIVTVALVAGALMFSSDHRRPSSVDSPETSHRSGDREEAVQAAIKGATAPQDWLYLSDDEIRHALDTITTPRSRERLADAAIEEVTVARASLATATGPVWWLVRPLAWQVESFDGTHATVSVWVVRILSARDVAAPQSSYATIEIDLEWSTKRWLIDDLTEARGPTPAAAPAEAAWGSRELDMALDGFTRVGEDGS